MISDMVRNTLKGAACDLYLKKWDEMRIENDVISGIIKTEWTTHTVGTQSGILFRAQIDCEDGIDYKVNFLFHERDLERGANVIQQMAEQTDGVWVDSPIPIPCAELYKFENLRGPSRSIH